MTGESSAPPPFVQKAISWLKNFNRFDLLIQTTANLAHDLQSPDVETNNIFNESLKFLQFLLVAQKSLFDKPLVDQK